MPTQEMWDDCKYNENSEYPPELKGFIGIFCAYRSAGFYKSACIHGEAGERQYRGRCNTLKKEISKYKGIDFIAADYHKILDYENCVIYIDPPYANGKHEYDVGRDFDYTDFWETVRQASEKNSVYVSEQVAPDDFEIIWELNRVQKVFGKDTTVEERLYKYKNK